MRHCIIINRSSKNKTCTFLCGKMVEKFKKKKQTPPPRVQIVHFTKRPIRSHNFNSST